jgi:UDP-N-acetylmuramate dehydrogenase
MHNLRELLKKINIEGAVLFHEPMKKHTSFCIGGPADAFVTPHSIPSLIQILQFCKENRVPFFILGKGANILVADNGIRGVVVDISALSGITCEDTTISAEAGAEVSAVAETALEAGLAGLEFFYTMPGSVGGALWMNARCYGVSAGDVVTSVQIVQGNIPGPENKTGESRWITTRSLSPGDFSYKRSPFQDNGDIVLSATFSLARGDKREIKEKMEKYKEDREKKGHFRFPSAGSIFKNNKEFGQSTGQLIDSLSLKGYSVGDAQVSPEHGNIIINRGDAKARDVLCLIMFLEKKVKTELHLDLEREVILIGEWSKGDVVMK